MKELISIVIPVYNHARALERALVSIAAQTYKHIEVIVVDDGSDEAIGQLGNWTIGDGSVQVIRQNNRGAAAARNAGLKKANGEYVIFWDADVEAEPDFLEKLCAALISDPEASFSYANMYFGARPMPAHAWDAKHLKNTNYIHSTSLVRMKSAVKWDESLKRFQDWDLWLTMAEQGKHGVWVDEFLFAATPNEQGMSKWLPSFAYRWPLSVLPWWSKEVRAYKQAHKLLMLKHKKDAR